jgi:hypothetical protein
VDGSSVIHVIVASLGVIDPAATFATTGGGVAVVNVLSPEMV